MVQRPVQPLCPFFRRALAQRSLRFGELQVAHQVVGQVYAADLDLGPCRADGADDFAASAILLEAKHVIDTRAHLGAATVDCLLLVGKRLIALTLLADVAFITRPAQYSTASVASLR